MQWDNQYLRITARFIVNCMHKLYAFSNMWHRTPLWHISCNCSSRAKQCPFTLWSYFTFHFHNHVRMNAGSDYSISQFRHSQRKRVKPPTKARDPAWIHGLRQWHRFGYTGLRRIVRLVSLLPLPSSRKRLKLQELWNIGRHRYYWIISKSIRTIDFRLLDATPLCNRWNYNRSS